MFFPTEEFLKDLETIVNIDSGTQNIAGNCKIAEFFAEKFTSAGFTTKLEYVGKENRPMVIASTPDCESFDFYLGGHMDTVFADGTAKERPFKIDGSKAFGPGTVDMKAGALLILYLCRFIKSERPNISLCAVLNSDEETGATDSKEILCEMASKSGSAFIFEGARKQGQFVAERKGIAKYEINVQGIASHAGTAHWQGASAVSQLANCIVKLDKLNSQKNQTTVNVGIIQGGTAVNVIAPTAHALMEVRYFDEKYFKKAEQTMAALCSKPFVDGTSTTVTRLSHYKPLRITPKTHRLIEILQPLGISWVQAGGTSDANRIASEVDIPILDGCGPGGGFPHSEKEFLMIPTVEDRFNLMIKIFDTIKAHPA